MEAVTRRAAARLRLATPPPRCQVGRQPPSRGSVCGKAEWCGRLPGCRRRGVAGVAGQGGAKTEGAREGQGRWRVDEGGKAQEGVGAVLAAVVGGAGELAV